MYTKKAHIHFVGIGGIGMSGIATILHYLGYQISGCDADCEQRSVHDLTALGISVYHGNNTHACADHSIDILVYSSALKADNAEIRAAQARGIPTIPRALMLAELMRTKYSIAIAGAHGKTTTTSLISHILIEAHMDPTVIIGGHLKNISANARFGFGDFLVAEADESDRSLARLQPTLALVTNIDKEHLETYRDLDDIKNTFIQFLNNLPFYGKSFMCIDDPIVRSILPLPYLKVIKYGTMEEADIRATNIILSPEFSECTVHIHGVSRGTIRINLPGHHNVLNALGALALTYDIGVSFDTISRALANIRGVDRRFTIRGTYKGALVVDDYGHHPNEIFATLGVARARAQNKLTVVFQPHRYTRTYHLWDDFVNVLADNRIDQLIMTDIYAASEQPIATITGHALYEAVAARRAPGSTIFAPMTSDFDSIIETIAAVSNQNDLILMQGAGRLNKLAIYLAESV